MSKQRRLGALLIATFYFVFAGGIEFLHNHSDGVLSGWEASGVSAGRVASAHPGAAKAPTLRRALPDTDCAACQWARNSHATTPLVTVPLQLPTPRAAYAVVTPVVPSVPSAPAASRGPPPSVSPLA